MQRSRRRIAALILVVALGGVAVGSILAWQLLDKGRGDDPVFSSDYPVVDGGFESLPHTLAIGDLVNEADIVVVCKVGELTGYGRSPAGNPDLTAVVASYGLEVEEYLKGSGESELKFHKVVAYESPLFEATYLIDDLKPLEEGARYVMALRRWDDGRVELVAEPFRFRLEGGVARPESTLGELGGSALAVLGYAETSEAELKRAIVDLARAGTSAPGN